MRKAKQCKEMNSENVRIQTDVGFDRMAQWMKGQDNVSPALAIACGEYSETAAYRSMGSPLICAQPEQRMSRAGEVDRRAGGRVFSTVLSSCP